MTKTTQSWKTRGVALSGSHPRAPAVAPLNRAPRADRAPGLPAHRRCLSGRPRAALQSCFARPPFRRRSHDDCGSELGAPRATSVFPGEPRAKGGLRRPRLPGLSSPPVESMFLSRRRSPERPRAPSGDTPSYSVPCFSGRCTGRLMLTARPWVFTRSPRHACCCLPPFRRPFLLLPPNAALRILGELGYVFAYLFVNSKTV